MIAALFLGGCTDEESRGSEELSKLLQELKVTCDFLAGDRINEQYWVRSELDGRGLLIVTPTNSPNTFVLSLLAHGHERALETREIACDGS